MQRKCCFKLLDIKYLAHVENLKIFTLLKTYVFNSAIAKNKSSHYFY